MIFAIIAIVSLAILGLVAFTFGRHGKGDGEKPVVYGKDCVNCSGDNARCEQECTMEAATKPIEYFDDEELDTFKGRNSDDYTDDEVEQFAFVLHTMKPDEVAAWMRSLTLRGVSLPDQLRDEVLLLLE